MVTTQHPNAALFPQHDGKPFCHKPCYATLFGPKGTSVSPLPVLLCSGLQEGPGPSSTLVASAHPRCQASMD